MAEVERKANYSFSKKLNKWGVKTNYPVEAGDVIDVTLKNGGIKPAQIEKVVWNGDDIHSVGQRAWLCTIKEKEHNTICPHCGKSSSDPVKKDKAAVDEDTPF